MSHGVRSSLRDLRHHHRHHNDNSPSFSSSLLDEIYRSFDEERENRGSGETYRAMMMMKKSSNSAQGRYLAREKSGANHFVADQWMETDDIKLRQKSTAVDKFRLTDHRRQIISSSSTSSSDSSSGIGGFSSSDTESLYKSKSKPKLSPSKQIRTSIWSVNQPELHRKSYSDEVPATKKKKKSEKKEGNFHRRALKLYGDLKKVKQPISPGGKLASFLNSLFNSGVSKKPKNSSPSPSLSSSNGVKLDRETASAPSTVSSSRSCLSKEPSSAGRFERRSVRFCPVSVIVDEECRPCGQNSVYKEKDGRESRRYGDVADLDLPILAGDEEFKFQIKEKHRRVEEVAKELLKNYHRRKELTVNIVTDGRRFENNIIREFEMEEDEDEDEDDDDVSCCSSDLFELKNFLEIGDNSRYREELPVYETTHVDTNRAIANGFIL